jgi:hypothetical protein
LKRLYLRRQGYQLVDDYFQLLLLIRDRLAEGREIFLALLLGREEIREDFLVVSGHCSAGRSVAQREAQLSDFGPSVDAGSAGNTQNHAQKE